VTDVHAVVVGVKSAQIEPHAHHIRDGTAILDPPSLVVAGNSGPSSGVRILLIHQSSCLLRKSLTRRCPVLQWEKLVKQGIQDPADSKTSGSRVVTKDLSVGTLLLTLVQRDIGEEVCDLGRFSILQPALVENLAAEWRSTYAEGDFDIVVLGNGLRESCCAGHRGGGEDDRETHGDKS
jgi:hypothetical protein